MYKNIEILNKEKFKKFKFDKVNYLKVAKNAGAIVPLGFKEIIIMSHYAPIIINKLEDGEFVAFTSINPTVTIFNYKNIYIPAFIRTYPFLNLVVKDEDDDKGFRNVVGVDNSKTVNKKNGASFFKKNGSQSNELDAKIKMITELTKQRDISRQIVSQLKKHNLLVKQNFKVTLNEKEKVILDEFYVVDRQKLMMLDDATLALWAKKGWIHLIDTHLQSLLNFEKVAKSLPVEKIER